MINESGTMIESAPSKEKKLAYVVDGKVGAEKDGEFTPAAGGGGGDDWITVTLLYDDVYGYSIDITFEELKAAIAAGKKVFVKRPGDDLVDPLLGPASVTMFRNER